MSGEFQAIHDERVTLRLFSESDISEQYLSWLNEPEVVKYSNQRFQTHTAESARDYLHSFDGTSNLFLAIINNANNEMVGTLTVYCSVPHKTADIGILIGDKRVWGQGLGLAAWRLAISYVLDTLGYRKVTAGTLKVNQGMVRIMEKSGMRLEAVRARQELVEGQEVDIVYYAKFAD